MKSIFRALRICNDLSVREVAEKVGVSTAYIHAIEKGDSFPSRDKLVKYSKALGFRPSDIMYLCEETENSKHSFSNQLRLVLAKMADKMEKENED